jgi:tetratricopeptide (TPR) repeat protein
MFNRQQYIAIFSAILLVVILYFGCDRVPKNHKKEVEKMPMDAENGKGIENVVIAAKVKLADDKKTFLDNLEQQLKLAQEVTSKSRIMKQIASFWYQNENKTASGYFANKIAEIDQTEMAWNIAGSTLYEAIKENENPEARNFCTENAIKAFEKASAKNPSDLVYKINAALCYAENPPQDTPMKGILILLDLDKKNPDNPQILFQLAKLGLKTNQYDKAIARLEQILKKIPNSPEAICLLSDAYRGKGDQIKADALAKKCEASFKK